MSAANLRAAAALVPDGRSVVAVDGVDGAGKTTFADALAAELRSRDRTVERASIDGFHHVLAHGLFCQRPELAGCFDRVVFLDVPFEVSVGRMAVRDGSAPDPDRPDQRRYVDAQLTYFEQCRPQERADLVVDNR